MKLKIVGEKNKSRSMEVFESFRKYKITLEVKSRRVGATYQVQLKLETNVVRHFVG